MVSEEFDRVNNKSVDDNKSVDYDAVIESVDKGRASSCRLRPSSQSPDQPTTSSGQVHVELTLKLHSYPKPDRENV
jgi:hypothetical protein